MKVLLVGSGGREDALAWALSNSAKLTTLRCAPGNGGTARHAENLAIGAEDVDALVRHAVEERYDLVVVGPEAPLVAGLADRLADEGIAVFGPAADAAQLEGSKIFSKLFMQRHSIPTADFQVFSDPGEARAYLESPDTRYPLVVKADGLAAGKGVILADDRETAVTAAEGMLSGRDFGDAGRKILIEEMLRGREASFFVLSDGRRFVELATCQDYKRAHDGDTGLNTGGMGTYSPSAWLDDATRQTLLEKVVRPTIDGMAAEGMPYRGVLYTGVMLTAEGPKVLEFNARFGDPETQVLMPRLDGDWLDLLDRAARGELGDVEPAWKNEAAVCVVMAAGGYPGSYGKGFKIEGLERAEASGAVVFHAGTRRENDDYVTSGGRVLGVTALGVDLDSARRNAYAAVGEIRWDDEHHRNDIALDAVQRRDR
ncbi:MAG: phosphoribosylamine--glycine ligase [Acidobacteria bacterium]|nr:phosphoribosylamine--glycine ligase [Acidobacteriota bacterium]NIM63251.1 phosphoribosylamine--glycine ligase [Acidobacteriota bacterium]NIO60044.1 phosphoribosylamine--glycine ligase [Acidobacteriota bacterium]NIQ31115.1 phosphoribosylamine--glycine ligase [Acidobacteriota bacterium]NIQ86224.1 phosphoribosylamine--glycine ligase [Acidobacteriota bacterium]